MGFGLEERLKIIEEELKDWEKSFRKTKDKGFISAIASASYFSILFLAAFLDRITTSEEKEVALRIASKAYQMHEDYAKRSGKVGEIEEIYRVYERIKKYLGDE